ncbi:MAG TPA: zinc-binding dehydrogenase [Caulobacteraceae bacterium]|nr:zinc-binding dehydrogenase [Caulobacteraceae bacterium]
MAKEGLQLRSLVKASGELELSLVPVAAPDPAADEVVVRIEAAPINPSDLGLLLGPADVSTIKHGGDAAHPVVTATVPERFMRAAAGRLDQSMPVGNEGAGVVVEAGSSTEAQGLMGKVVGILGGATYGQYRTLKAADCLPMPDGVTPAQGAAAFVNPLTALGMVGTMRLEGHKALVHTAAASNLGQMLVKLCLAEAVPLVNVVRSAEQEALLRGIGATHVCDSSKPSFMGDLSDAIAATSATLGFDAIGGGPLAGQILTAMEIAANRNAASYSRYGSTTYKQVYIYGGLNTGPTELNRAFGMAWGLGGWLLTPFLGKVGAAEVAKLRARVASEITTTFASHYTKTISLAQALDPAVIAAYNKRATGEKYLINPSLS